MLSPKFQSAVEAIIGDKIHGKSTIGGGDIHKALKITTMTRSFFLKYNDGLDAASVFKSEAFGLDFIRDTRAIDVPGGLKWIDTEDEGGLIMDYISSSHPSPVFWRLFGKKLASLHKNTNPAFGFVQDNYIGHLPQSNSEHTSWPEFYSNERILPQIIMARDLGHISREVVQRAERFCNRLNDLFPSESSALLHGDLWSGNFICQKNMRPCLIDPAVYYGHREMDLAMSVLFGGFDQEFYTSYNTHFPLENGWENRIPYGQLYYLLVHVNLFGISYLERVNGVLKSF